MYDNQSHTDPANNTQQPQHASVYQREHQPAHSTSPMHSPNPTPILPQEPEVKPVSYGNRKVLSQKAQRMIIYLYIAVAILLATRFIFSLIAANMETPFVGFIYGLSMPLMIPFANMFGPPLAAGVHRIEFEVLVALLIYALIFFGVAKLVSIIFD